MELEEVTCSNCGMACYKTNERRYNAKGQYNRWLINRHDGTDHHCIKFTHKDKGANILGSSDKGMPCWKGCKTFIIRDDSFPDLNRGKYPEPKLREVVKRTDTNGNLVFDLDSGQRHTFYRCMMLREGYSDMQVRTLERSYYEKHAWYLASLSSMFNPPKI